MNLRRLLCLLGHGDDVLFSDGMGAAWTRCERCSTLTGSHSFHDGRPWNEGNRYRVRCTCAAKSIDGAVHSAVCAISMRDWQAPFV